MPWYCDDMTFYQWGVMQSLENEQKEKQKGEKMKNIVEFLETADVSLDEAIDYANSYAIGMPLAILNTSILTAAGSYTLQDITVEEARELVEDNNLDSAVGHASTAQVMTTLLGVEIPTNRQLFVQQPGQQALVFKLNGRPAEGKILTAEEIEAIGYKFQLLTRIA